MSLRGVALPAVAGAALAVALVARSSSRSAAADAQRVEEHKREMDGRRAQHQDIYGCTATAVVPNAQGLKLYLRHWSPKQGVRVRGVVVMVHGFTVHSGLFSGVAQHLAKQGLAVVSYDQQGHGLSDCCDGLRGYVRQFADFVDDAAQVLAWARSQYPGVPSFLLGESLGGTVVLSALRRASVQAQVQGAVLMAPGIRVSKAVLPPWPLMPFLRAAAALFPRTEVPDDKVISPEKWKPMFGDAAAADAAFVDPLCTLVRPRLSMLCMVAVCEELFGHLEEINTPFLAVHAPEDARCEFPNTEALVARAATTDKELLVAKGGSHMLFLDQPEITAKVLAAVTGWLTARC